MLVILFPSQKLASNLFILLMTGLEFQAVNTNFDKNGCIRMCHVDVCD